MANYPYMNFQQPYSYNPYQMAYQTPQSGQGPQQIAATQSIIPTVGSVAPQQPISQQGIVCCPVTSKAEAEAYRVEALGPGVLMPDLGHGMIYYKKFNNQTALADFAEFRYVPPQEPSSEPQAQDTPAIDLSAVVGAFSSKFDEVEKKIDIIVDRLPIIPEKPVETAKGGAKK